MVTIRHQAFLSPAISVCLYLKGKYNCCVYFNILFVEKESPFFLLGRIILEVTDN